LGTERITENVDGGRGTLPTKRWGGRGEKKIFLSKKREKKRGFTVERTRGWKEGRRNEGT